MKRLEEFIIEKLKVSKVEKITYYPNTKQELVELVIKEIETNGPECSLNHIDVSNIDDMSFLFRGGDKYKYYSGHPVLSEFDGDISGWDVSNVTDMHHMFDECKYTGKNGDISNWDVSNVKDMKYMFLGSEFNGDISMWDVSNVENMYGMFDSAKFNGDISNWDVSNVKTMKDMFLASKFNGDISNWDVSTVTDMSYMFYRSSLENNPPKWYHK